jgi:hypothetical protein
MPQDHWSLDNAASAGAYDFSPAGWNDAEEKNNVMITLFFIANKTMLYVVNLARSRIKEGTRANN